MVASTTFYIDDSGTRHPNHKAPLSSHGNDWFAFGGILINDEDRPAAELMIDQFRQRWPQMGDAPMHSVEIRACSKNFAWLGKDENIKSTFLNDLQLMLTALPVIGLACVIDRPGYNKRYVEKYGRERWMLCKSAFTIAAERAVKHAMDQNRKLRIFVEKCSKQDDKVVAGYYRALKNDGHGFNQGNAAKYAPLTNTNYRETLYEFRIKAKSSRLMQIADIYLWPMCMGGYSRSNHPYNLLLQEKKLIECHIPVGEIEARGSKYYCFDGA